MTKCKAEEALFNINVKYKPTVDLMTFLSTLDTMRLQEKQSGILTYRPIMNFFLTYMMGNAANLYAVRDRSIIKVLEDPLLQRVLGGFSLQHHL